uniref:Uncharacterized protein n=1 Tax=Ciona intestinalis TaxID=7719 RepID=H2XPP5_CIOIN
MFVSTSAVIESCENKFTEIVCRCSLTGQDLGQKTGQGWKARVMT